MEKATGLKMDSSSVSPSSSSSSVSVYTKKKLLSERASARRVLEVGESFKKLQMEMAEPRPSGGLSRLPDHAISELLTCVRCGRIPNPKDYLVCEDGGHNWCGPCAIGSSTKKKEKVLEACCATRNLRKGSSRLLEVVLKNSMWKCNNKKKGCTQIVLGSELDSHLAVCKFRGVEK